MTQYMSRRRHVANGEHELAKSRDKTLAFTPRPYPFARLQAAIKVQALLILVR